MRVPSTLITAGLAVSLATLPLAALADDAAEADPFRPVQPAWPEGWSAAGDKPAGTTPPAGTAADERAGSTLDEPAATTTDGMAAAEPVAQPGEVPGPKVVAEPEPANSAISIADVDLRTPHLLMATGGALIGVSALAAIAIGIALDRPDLAGATFALGGVLGVGGLTVGVVMQNNRLEAAGQEVLPALPSGMMLRVALVR